MIYASTKQGIRGLLSYRSTYRLRAHGDTAGALSAQRVYRFKTKGESGQVWKRLVETAAADLGCGAVWTIPGHDPDKTSKLQDVFGVTIRRTRAAALRKYKKSEPVDVSGLDFPPAPGGPVLLLDDIATTGGTLCAIRDHLKGQGVEAIPFALGVNWRLIENGCDLAALSAQWEAMSAEVHGPAQEANELRRKRRKAASLIARRPVADTERRERLERDPAAWLRWYMPASFPLPFGQVHKDIVRAAVRAIRTGAGMAVAAPRGTGKTTVLAGLALWAILSGACRFPVVAGWSHSAARRMLRKWICDLSENARLLADYPEACAPFEVSTHANRLKGCAWADTGEPCGGDVQQMNGLLVLPDSLGALAAISIAGNSRGLAVGLPDGSTLRPDVLLLDDPQDKTSAESPALTKKTVERIEGDLFNLAGPTARLSIMAAVTIISENDVATHFLEHPDFESVKVGQVTAWPTGWEEDASPVRTMWDRWNKIRCDGLAKHDGGKLARAFYKTNKAEMTKGMAVSWPARFDRKRKDPDAFFAAMLDFYRLGERAFMAERQNAPLKSGEASVFELPQSHVAGKVNGLERRTAPQNAVHLVGMCDLNADAARWAVAAASNTASLSILDYGAFPGGATMLLPPGESEAVAMMRGLSGLDEILSGLSFTKGTDRLKIDLMLLDCGSWMQSVFDWLAGPARLSRIPWLASRGWPSRSYRPGRTAIGKPGEEFHLADWPGKGRVLVHNSDYWRHKQQKSWLLPVNAPEAIALFGKSGTRHDVFADGVVAERLTAYAETPAGTLWRWDTVPGLRNDYGDVATGLLVAASRLGLSATGRATIRPRKRYTQKDLTASMQRKYG